MELQLEQRKDPDKTQWDSFASTPALILEFQSPERIKYNS